MVKVRHWRRAHREQKKGVGKAFGMDPILPRLERETRRRRRAPMFRHQRVPVRMLVPNFFTLLALCAGLTSIRMSIEGRYELALGAIVFAALLDGIDGRVARLLKASSRFGAELDSLADFVNFGVAPAFLIFTWGLGDLKEPRLDLRHDLRARLGAAAGALQRGARRRQAEVAVGVLQRHADPGSGDRRVAAGLYRAPGIRRHPLVAVHARRGAGLHARSSPS